MKKKTLKTYFLDFKVREINRTLTALEITNIFDYIRLLPLDKELAIGSRVLEIDQSVYYMVLSDDNDSIPTYENCISGIFVKDRAYNYPYESNNSCDLTELTLSRVDDKIAEITYFILDKDISTMLWISNRYVAGFSKLYLYINMLLNQTQSQLPRVEMSTFTRPDAEQRFDRAVGVKSYCLKTTGLISHLIPYAQTTLDREREFQGLSLENIVNYIEIKLSFVTNTGELNRSAQKEIVKCLKRDYELVKSEAKVVIDDQSQDIDFIDDSFILTQEIEISERYTNYSTLFQVLYNQLLRQKENIRRQYR